MRKSIARILIVGGLMFLTACTRSWSNQLPLVSTPGGLVTKAVQTLAPGVTIAPRVMQFPTNFPGAPLVTPTPDSPRQLPELRQNTEEYIVQSGDSLGRIAQSFGVPLELLIAENTIVDPDVLEVGQTLIIPAPQPGNTGSALKIIPDSELVYSPSNALFDVEEFVKSQGGYLSRYYEDVDDISTSGAEVVERVAREFSVNPRLLLAVLEVQSGWVTQTNPPEERSDYPIGVMDSWRKGLYRQLAWTANNLNRGYYLWRANGAAYWLTTDGEIIPPDGTINAGTAGVQQMFALLYSRAEWDRVVGEDGLFAVYQQLFGFPFDFSYEPMLPAELTQPTMQLPFEGTDTWSFTGGPHGGWGDGSAWSGLDFAPPGDALGCVSSDAWVTAAADGVVVRSDSGVVVIDLDGDGYEQTGWSILYLHIETRDRVSKGTQIKAGERVGHPSCEGGVSNGTHVHMARRYNGEWIPADGNLPFILDGWISAGTGVEYDGTLTRNGVVVEAWDRRLPENQISR